MSAVASGESCRVPGKRSGERRELPSAGLVDPSPGLKCHAKSQNPQATSFGFRFK
jgi:hypothetical protein